MNDHEDFLPDPVATDRDYATRAEHRQKQRRQWHATYIEDVEGLSAFIGSFDERDHGDVYHETIGHSDGSYTVVWYSWSDD